MSERLGVHLFHDDAKIPSRQSAGAVGYDLYAYEYAVIEPGQQEIVGTGIGVKFPEPGNGFLIMGMIKSRSGLSAKLGVEVGAGVIDPDYRGEVKVVLRNHGKSDFRVNKGDRIAQLLIQAVAIPNVQILSDEDWNATDRGTGGFGSTGV